jgi:ribonuclease-3 family protein
MEESIKQFGEAFHLKKMDAGQYSPLVLAYMGDAVYEVMIRTMVVNEGNMQVNKLHKRSAGLVKAQTQAQLVMALEEDLTEEELAVYKRGRNAKSASMAKNATMKDYRMATGFEALVGYLYLSEQYERLAELVSGGLTKLGILNEERPDEI